MSGGLFAGLAIGLFIAVIGIGVVVVYKWLSKRMENAMQERRIPYAVLAFFGVIIVSGIFLVWHFGHLA